MGVRRWTSARRTSKSCCREREKDRQTGSHITSNRVSNAHYDEATFTATLDAKAAVWKDIANTFTVDFGKVQLPPAALRTEGALSAAVNFDDTVSIDLTQTVTNPVIFSTTVGASGFDLTVSCLDCGTKGTLDVSGHVTVDWFTVTELSVEASPENFEARLQLGVKVKGKANGPAASFTKQLLSAGLGGFSVCCSGSVFGGRVLTCACRFLGFSRWALPSTMRLASARLSRAPPSSATACSQRCDDSPALPWPFVGANRHICTSRSATTPSSKRT